MKHLIYILIFLFSITFINQSKSADIIVNGSGLSGTYNTISAGINAANSGDRILISNQSFPYQEDTIFIDKSVTIMPYNDVAHILFEGHIKITLDSISDLTIIGFDSDQTNIFSEFIDTSRNSLSTINIIDCKFNNVYLSKTKTSTYISYSTITNEFTFSHGDLIGNNIANIYFGNFDCSLSGSNNNDCLLNFVYSGSGNYLNQSPNWWQGPNECEVFSKYISFGDVDTYSDTCNIIGNTITRFLCYNEDFPFNVRNNQYNYFDVYLIAPLSKGVNQIINNNIYHRSYFYASYCDNTSEYNFRNFSLRYLNNDNGQSNYLTFWAPPSNGNYTCANLSPSKNSISSYNKTGYISYNDFNNCYISDSTFFIGPDNNGNNPNPSSEFLNLDLSLNTIGSTGGSFAFDNINPYGYAGFSSLGSSTNPKARITYLNLPTQIFDPSNIKIKAKAVHGN